MQTIFKDIDEKYFKIPGYIQHFSVNQFIVHLYSELGISILVHHLRSKSPVSLYLDATGGVVSKIPEQPKPVLYYALTLPGNAGRDAPPLPICEMLSNEALSTTNHILAHAIHFAFIKVHPNKNSPGRN